MMNILKKNINLILYLGWIDIKLRYRRSVIGPWWLTLATTINIIIISIIFGNIFKIDINKFIPYVSIGIIFWNFIAGCITESCQTFVNSESIIKQIPLPSIVYIMRIMYKNTIVLLHSFILVPIIMIYFKTEISYEILYFIPAFIVLYINLVALSILISILCTRYRDLAQVTISMLQVLFYLTPVMWIPDLIASNKLITILEFNPFYHFLNIIRNPLIGQKISITSWLITLTYGFIGVSISILFYNRFKKRIIYWL